jgi:hypothetical protein
LLSLDAAKITGVKCKQIKQTARKSTSGAIIRMLQTKQQIKKDF